jgi:hydrogenase nickel incorporation protein HypB
MAACGVLSVNLIGSPGSGKTSLLECTIETLPRYARVAVLTGDVQTEDDAERVRRYGFPVRQINTGSAGCLDGRMIEQGLADWRLEDIDLLLIENVGNLIGPADHDLGETAKIVLSSVTEGEDEPSSTPRSFTRQS